jgi:hypothetical protein
MADERLSRADVQLVLRRAAELERRPEGSEELTPAELAELAHEVGLSPAAVEQALSELRAGALAEPAPPSTLERVLGRQAITVERVVPGSVAEVERRVDRLLQAELLRKKRDLGPRALWEPAPDLVSKLRRALFGGNVALPRVRELASTVLDAGQGRSLVRFTVDVGALQRKVVGGAVLGTLAGVGAALTLSALGTPHALEWLAAAGLSGTGALASLRLYRGEVGNVATALEHLCDRLERDRPGSPSALDLIASWAARPPR